MQATTESPYAPDDGGSEMQRLTALVARLAGRVEELQGSVQTMRTELAENTRLTNALKEAWTFVSVGTKVLKWIGVVVFAIGSVVAGWKMIAGGHPPPDITPKP